MRILLALLAAYAVFLLADKAWSQDRGRVIEEEKCWLICLSDGDCWRVCKEEESSEEKFTRKCRIPCGWDEANACRHDCLTAREHVELEAERLREHLKCCSEFEDGECVLIPEDNACHERVHFWYTREALVRPLRPGDPLMRELVR